MSEIESNIQNAQKANFCQLNEAFFKSILTICLSLFLYVNVNARLSDWIPRGIGGAGFNNGLRVVVNNSIAEYYVDTSGSDSDAGTQESPWLTINYAATKVKPGDTVYINPGTYSITQNILISTNGEEGNPITFKSSRSGVIINGSGLDGSSSKKRDAFFIDKADYIIVEGLEIRNAYRAGIRISLSDHVTIRNVISRNNGTWGIFTDFSNYLLIEDNECFNSGSQHGIYVSNSGDYPTVRGNVIHDNPMCGLHMNGDINMGGDGIISSALVENNIIYNNGLKGGSGINCDGVVDSVIRNNLLYDTHASGISLYRIDGGVQSNNNTVYHNTIIIASNGRWAINLKNGSSKNKIYNNILLTEHSWRGSIAADSLEGLESDYNIFTTNTKTVTPDDDTSYLTFQQWQAQGFDRHSVQANIPDVFVNPSANDYQLKDNSPAIDNGTFTYTYIDILGKTRPQGNGYDIGAYEKKFDTIYSYIKGYVRKKDNSAIAGVVVTLAGNKLATDTTQANGYYEFMELSAGTYTVIPILAGYAFIPASRTYQPLSSNMDNQDFVGLNGKIVIQPTNGTVGAEVEVQGSDFLPTSAVRIAFGKIAVGTWTSNFAGTFTAKFTIPLTPEGTTTLTATGLNSELEQVHLVARDYFYVKFELSHFRIAPITTPQTAGIPFTVTITTIDNTGGTLTNFSAGVMLEDLSGSILPKTTTNFIAGLWQGTVTITKAGTTAITADYAGKLGTSNPFYVEAGTPTKFIVEPQNAVDVPADGSVSITAQLMDAYDNPVGSSGIICNVEVVVGSGTAGILSATTTTTNQSGQIATITYFVSTHTGDRAKLSIINYQFAISNYSGTITTTPGTLTHFVFDPIGTQTAGVDFPITITAMDKYDNITPFQGTASLSDLTNSLNPNQISTFINGSWTGIGSITVAGITTITAVYGNGTISGTSDPFLVRGGTLTYFEIATITTQTAGVGFNITIKALDKWANVADEFTGVADLTLNPPMSNPPLTPPRRGIPTPNPSQEGNPTLDLSQKGNLTPDLSQEGINPPLNPTTTTNFTAGLWQGTVIITTAGTTAITASYQDKAGTSNSFYVSPAQLDYFKFATITTQIVTKPFQITITAYDGYGNIADYTGSAELTSTKGIYPQTATPFQSGIWKGTVTMSHVGTTTITANAGTKTGTSNDFAVIPSELTDIVIIPSAATVTVDSMVEFTASGYDILWNEIKLAGGRWGVIPNIGTFTNLEGPVTTFIAGTKATAGIITFATNSISGTANILILPGALHRLNIIPPAATIAVMAKQPFEIRGEDKYGNKVDASVNWQVSGELGTLTSTTGSCTLWTAGTKAMAGWLVAGSGSVQATASVRITAGDLHHISITPAAVTITVLGSLSLKAEGYDEFNNKVGITGRWEVVNGLGSSSETVATRTTFTAGTKVGKETIRYICDSVIGQAEITLKPLPLERFAFTPIWLSPKAGQEFTISVTALDRYDNWVEEFCGSGGLTDLTNTISPTEVKFTSGEWIGNVTITKAIGSTTIFIISQGKRGTSTSFRVLPGDVAGFEFGTIATQLVRKPFGISIRALDGFGNTADYNGTVSLTDTTDSIKTTAQFQQGILTATVTITKSMPEVVITADNPITTQNSRSFFVLIDHTREEKIGIPQELELRLEAYFLPADFYPVIVPDPHETQINIACFYHDQSLTTKRLPESIYRIDAFDEQKNLLTDGYGTGSSAFLDINYDEQALDSIKEDTLRVYKLQNSRWLELPDAVVDVIGNVVRAGIDELGVFMLSGAITPQDLSILVVYPNPFKPTRGDEYIYFEGLPANTRIRIYDISGTLIRDVENQQAVWQWDVQDMYGQKVDSGIYIYIVTTEEGLKKIGKIGVIR